MLPNDIAEDQLREVKKMKAPTVAPQPGPPITQPSIVISDALAKFIGTDGTFPQDDALKYLWDYIKANQLEVWLGPFLFFFAEYPLHLFLLSLQACSKYQESNCAFTVLFLEVH